MVEVIEGGVVGIEMKARDWAHRHGVQNMQFVVSAYRAWSEFRFRNKWDDFIGFRGHAFSIGKDLTLFPAVHTGGFERAELDELLPRVSRDAVVWDVGANVGIYTVLLAARAAEGHVYAFEPVPATYDRLQRNVAHNAVDNVTLTHCGLSSQVGVLPMAVHADAHGCDSIGGIVEDGAEQIEVAVTTGELFLRESGSPDPDVIKVDIEGHEPEFLRGAWEMIARRRPLLMLEVNPASWHSPEMVSDWERTLTDLFTLYGQGEWFDPDGRSTVSSVDVAGLGKHAYTLILGGAAAAA